MDIFIDIFKAIAREVYYSGLSTRAWNYYRSTVGAFVAYGIPLVVCVLLILFFFRFVITFERRSFFSTIFNLLNIKGFIGGKLRESKEEEKKALAKQKRRRKARKQERYREHGLTRRRL